MKEEKKYKMLQLDDNIHKALKEYCNHHGFQMKGFVQALIRQALANNKKK
jgi:urocanate hydratase